MSEQLFFIDSDGSGHWYLIPFDKKEHWREWTSIDEEDERSWSVPEYAKRIQDPSSVYFKEPIL